MELNQANKWTSNIWIESEYRDTCEIKEVKLLGDQEYLVERENGKEYVTTNKVRYEVSYQTDSTQQSDSGLIKKVEITNAKRGVVDLSIQKEWVDGGNSDSRPSEVAFLLTQNNHLFHSAELGIVDGIIKRC